jgi:hypothetical protein
VALLDADDVWHPDKIQSQVAVLEERPEVAGIYVNVERIDEADNTVELLPAKEFDNLTQSLLLHSSVIPGSSSSLMLRREVFESIGMFDPDFSQCADWDFLIRASLQIRLAPLDDLLVKYRTSSHNMSSNIERLERDTFGVLDKFYASEAGNNYKGIKNRVYSNHWLILSGSYLHVGQQRNAARCLARALRTDPTNVGYPLGLPIRALRRIRNNGRINPA